MGFEDKYRPKSTLSGSSPVPPAAASSPAMEALKAAAQDEYKPYFFGAHTELEL